MIGNSSYAQQQHFEKNAKEICGQFVKFNLIIYLNIFYFCKNGGLHSLGVSPSLWCLKINFSIMKMWLILRICRSKGSTKRSCSNATMVKKNASAIKCSPASSRGHGADEGQPSQTHQLFDDWSQKRLSLPDQIGEFVFFDHNWRFIVQGYF